MAAAETAVSGQFLQQSLAKHRALVLTLAGITVASSLFYYLSASQPVRHARPLRRRNAVHRHGRPSAGNHASQPVEPEALARMDNSNAETHELGEDITGLAEAEAETEVGISQPPHPTAASSLAELVYYIAEESSLQRAYVHRGITCDECHNAIRGVRYKCSNCFDFDLCSTCEAFTTHPKTHVFQKIKIPIPGLVWNSPLPSIYPGGIEGQAPPELPKGIVRKLFETTKYEMDEIQALFDIFLSYANVLWPSDPTDVGRAINEKAFTTAWRPGIPAGRARSNFLCNRVFAFYDSDGNGLVGFEEFVQGIATLRRKSRQPQNQTRIIFDVFDADGDGWVSRKDVLRLFKGLYKLQKSIAWDEAGLELKKVDPMDSQKTIFSTHPLNRMLNSLPLSQQQLQPSEKPTDEDSPSEVYLADEMADSTEQDQIISEIERMFYGADISGGGEEPVSVEKSKGQQEPHHFLLDEEDPPLLEPWETSSIHSGRSSNSVADVHVEPNRVKTLSAESSEANGEACETTVSPANEDEEVDSTPVLEDVEPSATQSQPPNHQSPPMSRLVSNGYNIPISNTGIVQDTTYLIMEENINRILDQLFKAKEDLAVEVEQTKSRREEWHQQKSQSNHEKIREAVDPLAGELPKDLQKSGIYAAETTARFALLDDVEDEVKSSGGPGRLNFTEFEKLMSVDEGKRLGFLGSWRELGNF
jgi:Ca2+-binding EF-hand superfamily protein